MRVLAALFVILLVCGDVHSQGGGATAIRSGSSLPSVCTPASGPQGNFFYLTTAATGNPVGMYFCITTNVWIPMRTLTVDVANEAGTGTTVNKLAKLTGAPSTAIITSTSDTGGILGIVYAGAGKTGNATIALSGLVACVFDGATTAGHYVQNSTVTNGDCKDVGASYPTSGEVQGIVLSTNAATGTYNMILFPPEIRTSSTTYTGTIPILVTGTVISCPTCAAGPPGTALGSIVGTGWNQGAATAGFTWPFSASSATGNCTNIVSFWPISGYFRNPTVVTAASNPQGLSLRLTPVPDCLLSGAFPFLGGVVVAPGAAAGGYIDANANEWWHVNQGSTFVFGQTKQALAATGPALTSSTVEFVADSGVWSLLGGNNDTASAASTTVYAGPAYTSSWLSSANESGAQVPVPVAGTLQYFCWASTGSSTNINTFKVRINAADTAIVAASPASAPSGSAVFCDFTDTASVSAGDAISWGNTTGAGTVFSNYQLVLVGFTPTTGSTSIIYGSFNANSTTTTKVFQLPFSSARPTTESNGEIVMPRAGTVSNLRVIQKTANGGGITTTVTVRKGSGPTCTMADTIVTGTITSGSGTGVINVDTTHSVAFARGDCMSVGFVTSSGTSGTMGGWSVAYD